LEYLEAQAALVPVLLEEINILKEQFRLSINGKNSSTSHTPPSHQIGRSNTKSLRVKSSRTSGGQVGHKGTTLPVKQMPDETITHSPANCTYCGIDLKDSPSVRLEKRQEVVIPVVQIKYVEHISHTKICGGCGHKTSGTFPENIKAPIQYSGHIGALVAYLSVFHYMPYGRITILLKDFFGISMSQGTVDNLLKSATKKAQPVYNIIQQRIQNEAVVGSDETGTRINGGKGWFHTWQSEKLTFIAASLDRGFKTVVRYFADGFTKSVYVSDCWAAQLKVAARLHQLCLAHLLRELNNFEDALSCKWSTLLKTIFCDAIQLKKEMLETDYHITNEKVIAIEQMFDKLLLNRKDASDNKKVQAFINRLEKNRNSIFTFLHYHYVPPDNNASERAIRNIKIKTKVSGQFRSEAGATRFAVIRSVIDTTRKNGNNILNALCVMFNYSPEL